MYFGDHDRAFESRDCGIACTRLCVLNCCVSENLIFTSEDKLSPNKKRRKNAAFTILAEPETSQPNSRSSSPSGRLSPFKGRGFNPTGSRLASPTGSPPPPQDDQRKSAPQSPKRSQIPTFQRRGSSAGGLFGEKVYPDAKPLAKRKDPEGLSKSLSNISTKRVHYKPPSGPRRSQNTSYRQSVYTRLSPITGSSPETVPDLPKQNQSSSPSKIPRSRSTPPSRSTSPPGSKQPSRNASRNASRNPSRNTSRDPSPASKSFVNNVPVRNNYKNVKSKVNTFNTAKPKVPPKPQVPSTKTNTTDRQKNDTKPNYLRNNKVSPTTKTDTTNRKPLLRNNSKKLIEPSSNGMSKTISNNSLPVEKVNEIGLSKNGEVAGTEDKKSENGKGEEEDVEIIDVDKVKTTTTTNSNGSKETHSNVVDALGNIKNVDILTLPGDSTPPPSAALPSVTKTVTKPILSSDLLSEALQDSDGEIGNYLPDARNLSSSSVSTALNRMSNTVLDSKTVLKDRTISPAVRAVMRFKKGSQDRSSSGESKSGKSTGKTNTPTDTSSKMETKSEEEQKTGNAVSKSEENGNKTNNITNNHNSNNNNNNNIKDNGSVFNNNNQTNNNNSNHNNNNSFLSRMENVTGGGMIVNNDKDNHKQGIVNERKFGSMEPSSGATVIKVENDKTKMARTVVVTDVKPIQITVREKPSSEVESGNLIVADNTVNGLRERSSLNPSSHQSDLEHVEDGLHQNVCQRLSSFFKTKMTCAWCKRNSKLVQATKELQPQTKSKNDGDGKKSIGCWNCRRKFKVKDKKEKIKKDLNLVGEDSAKKTWWSKLNLFRKGRVLDKVGPPWNQRRKTWMEKKFGNKKKGEEQMTELPKRSLCGGRSCKDVLKLMFCLSACTCCMKKQKAAELDIRRTASITSKKKSLTPTLPVEDPKPKLDLSLVEHTSLMKGAIPVLPVPLAWFCLFLNVFLPGVGTVLSGLLCLCFGIPRFSQNDGARQRIGSFLIDIVIGCGQLFTVLFCLVGWGWSIWWGVIMIKIARKYKKIKHAEKLEEEANKVATSTANQNHANKDVEKGT